MATHSRGFSPHRSQATITTGGSNLTKVAQREATIIKDKIVQVLTKLDMQTILRGQSIVPMLSDGRMVLSTKQGHRSICPRDTGVRQGEASTQTLKVEASIGTGTRDRERKANQSMTDPGLQGRALVELLKEIILTKVGKRKLYLGQEVILEVGVGLPV